MPPYGRIGMRGRDGGVEASMEAQGEGGRWSRLDARLRSLSPRRRVLIILSIFVAVYGSFIAMDGLLFRP
ncbi:MAG TPA: hypothetical protein PLI21_05065, partial [Methanomassiliicoccaceae archaeon]|nr:hypothetical protein [Methanomassiliicoccaceae archaeon]